MKDDTILITQLFKLLKIDNALVQREELVFSVIINYYYNGAAQRLYCLDFVDGFSLSNSLDSF